MYQHKLSCVTPVIYLMDHNYISHHILLAVIKRKMISIFLSYNIIFLHAKLNFLLNFITNV